MKYFILIFLITAGCIEVKKLSSRDVDLARCICKKSEKELRVVKREGHDIYLQCADGTQWKHEDDSYTEGCSK